MVLTVGAGAFGALSLCEGLENDFGQSLLDDVTQLRSECQVNMQHQAGKQRSLGAPGSQGYGALTDG